MFGVMSLFIESIATMLILARRPFSLIKLTCIFGVKSIGIIISTWIELMNAAISLHVNLVSTLVFWNVALITLPARILRALRREKLLEIRLQDMQDEMNALVWDRKELDEQLNIAIRERRMMEMMLEELEDEHDQAINTIELLEGELQDLKHENYRLKEIRSKDSWSSKNQLDTNDAQKIITALKYKIESLESTYIESGTPLEDLLIQKHDTDENEYVDERREVAVSQSLFSAIFSLLVGIIVFQAEHPCMPLVFALFFVVGLSLKSVVQFFSTIKNRPAFDAVALLSFNWFILGTVAYPTLPMVARIFVPFILRFLAGVLSWLSS